MKIVIESDDGAIGIVTLAAGVTKEAAFERIGKVGHVVDSIPDADQEVLKYIFSAYSWSYANNTKCQLDKNIRKTPI